jgi:hypothetical protein
MNSPRHAGGHIDVETRGPVVIARIDGGPHALFDASGDVPLLNREQYAQALKAGRFGEAP